LHINYKCPVCEKALDKKDNCYICPNNHNFDIAKQGYVKFAAAKKSYTNLSGDSKQMCLDRRKFLSNGFYFPLAKLLANTISELSKIKILPLLMQAAEKDIIYAQ
jgi:23S rRNA (guanine745-N1)-methyltransferase